MQTLFSLLDPADPTGATYLYDGELTALQTKEVFVQFQDIATFTITFSQASDNFVRLAPLLSGAVDQMPFATQLEHSAKHPELSGYWYKAERQLLDPAEGLATWTVYGESYLAEWRDVAIGLRPKVDGALPTYEPGTRSATYPDVTTCNFKDESGGTIAAVIFAELQARGRLAGWTLVGDATADAAGEAWVNTQDFSCNYGDAGLTVLQNMAALGLIEFRAHGRELRIYNAGTAGKDLGIASGQSPIFRAGADLISMAQSVDRRLPNYLTVFSSAGNISVEVKSTEGLARTNGKIIEVMESVDGITHQDALYKYAVVRLNALRNPSHSTDVEVHHDSNQPPGASSETAPRLGVEYEVGDWGYVDGPFKPARYRIKACKINEDATGVKTTVTLADRFLDQLILVQRALSKTDRLIGGDKTYNIVRVLDPVYGTEPQDADVVDTYKAAAGETDGDAPSVDNTSTDSHTKAIAGTPPGTTDAHAGVGTPGDSLTKVELKPGSARVFTKDKPTVYIDDGSIRVSHPYNQSPNGEIPGEQLRSSTNLRSGRLTLKRGVEAVIAARRDGSANALALSTAAIDLNVGINENDPPKDPGDPPDADDYSRYAQMSAFQNYGPYRLIEFRGAVPPAQQGSYPLNLGSSADYAVLVATDIMLHLNDDVGLDFRSVVEVLRSHSRFITALDAAMRQINSNYDAPSST